MFEWTKSSCDPARKQEKVIRKIEKTEEKRAKKTEGANETALEHLLQEYSR